MSKFKTFIRKYDFLLGAYRFKLREILFAQKPGTLKKEEIPFKGNLECLPEINGVFINCDLYNEYSVNATSIDIIDFQKRIITRYGIASPYFCDIIKLSKKSLPRKDIPVNFSFRAFYEDVIRVPHTSHMTPDGYICATIASGIYFIDTNQNKAYILPENYQDKIMVYCMTGGFSPDYKYFYFVRWSFEESMKIRRGEKIFAKCEIGRLRICDRNIEIIYEFDFPEEVHQIACSRDNKFLFIASWNTYLSHLVPSSNISVADEIIKYKEVASKLSLLATYDINKNEHSVTQLPVPIPAHIEFDPVDADIIYSSSHNIFNYPKVGMISGGPGAIHKMKVENGKSTIINSYSDDECLRTTQHRVFRYKNKTYIAFTTTPYKFNIIDAETMTLWRKIRIQPDPIPLFNNGYAQLTSRFPLSIDVSNDSKYIIAGQKDKFYVYDIENNYVLDLHLYLPGGKGIGHTRKVGE